MKKHLGDLEQLILLAVIRLGDEAYGVRIREMIRERTGRNVSAGGIYTVLSRMEEQGLVRSRLSESTHIRGGRRRKFYTPTPEGARVMQETYDAMENMAEGVLRRSSNA